MPSLSGMGGSVFCVLLLWEAAAGTEEMQCSFSDPAGELHPVQGLLERFEAGPGCAARQHGSKETHVVAVARATNAENKVTVLLKPLFQSPSPLRPLHLLLSSKLPVRWWLEAERLPPDLPVLVQVSLNSSVQTATLHLHIQTLRFLPFRPHALHRWALTHHGNLSSMTHVSHSNRVYIHLGEDPSLPAMCRLQAMFLSHNYIASDLQPQEVQGCVSAPAGGISPEVHVIKLHSAGSGLCGSLQVEVLVSLVPPSGNFEPQKVVLILSSSVPVNWAISARGVRGHISVHSSNSMSPPHPPEPNLTLSSTHISNLSTISDLLAWARQSGYPQVCSYTEADLANRFVIHLKGGGTGVYVAGTPLVVRPPWPDERHLRQWLRGPGSDRLAVQCEDGRLSVAMDQRSLQGLYDPVAAVTLRDPTCQAQFNGSHFLLVFPVISCGTEALFLGLPRGVQYKNMVLLWRDEPQTVLSKPPLGIQFHCLATVPGPPGPATDNITEPNSPQTGLVPWVPNPELSHLPTLRHKPGPALLLKLFVTEHYERRRIGPCVIPANHRIYIEISAEGPRADVVEVTSCVVSPLSDPKKSPFWSVISEGCSSDTSLNLEAKPNNEEEEEEEAASERLETGRIYHRDEEMSPRHKAERREATAETMEKKMQPLRFSFILRPVYNDSMQFLHCSLRLCTSDSPTQDSPTQDSPTQDSPTQDSPTRDSLTETATHDCHGGLRIPPLVSTSPGRQCEVRNLSRPVVVTQSMMSLAPKAPRLPAGQRTRSLSVAPLTVPQPEHRGSELQMGALMGVVFLSFVMGVGLTGGLWCIYSHTGGLRASRRGDDGYLTDHSPGGHNIWKPGPVSDQCSSSV